MSAEDQVNTLSPTTSRRPGLSLPITLIILIIAFGSLVAAGIPLLLSLTAVLGDHGPAGARQPGVPIRPVDRARLIGLAVGVDYSMFYLKREREERARGRGEQASLEAAAATSGRSVLISGLTVMIAMFGMFPPATRRSRASGSPRCWSLPWQSSAR